MVCFDVVYLLIFIIIHTNKNVTSVVLITRRY